MKRILSIFAVLGALTFLATTAEAGNRHRHRHRGQHRGHHHNYYRNYHQGYRSCYGRGRAMRYSNHCRSGPTFYYHNYRPYPDFYIGFGF